ncbi:MAG: hypothetical protein FWG45_06715 [Oscillospiraceae bacterium]|nr:hypothetical protein [Oscillospiraceae bacterium]
MFLFCIGENSLNCLFPPSINFLALVRLDSNSRTAANITNPGAGDQKWLTRWHFCDSW